MLSCRSMVLTWLSRVLACWRNWAHPVPVDEDMVVVEEDIGRLFCTVKDLIGNFQCAEEGHDVLSTDYLLCSIFIPKIACPTQDRQMDN